MSCWCEGLLANDALALLDRHDLTSGNSGNNFALAIGPPHRQFGRGRFAKTEVQPEIALRHV